MYFEKVDIEDTETGCQFKFQYSFLCKLKTSAYDAEYVGKKLDLLGYYDGQLMTKTNKARQIIDDIKHVIETTQDQIKTARGQIEDSGGVVIKYTDLEIAIIDFQMRSMISEKAMEIDDPWNPGDAMKRRGQIAVDYPNFDF